MARRMSSSTPSSASGLPRPEGRHRAWRTLPWLAVLAAVVLLALPLLGENGLDEYVRLRGQRDELRQEVTTLAATVDSLEANLGALATDPAALERLAREEYNMRQPGEEVLLLVTPPPRP